MFSPFEGGSVEKIEVTPNEFVVVNIPPVPPIYQIQNFDKAIADQKWERTNYPEWWDEAYEVELDARSENDNFRDKKCEQFRKQEWERRFNGHWCFIKGNPVYLPGKYYYYLNWIKNDNGYPEFRETDRKEFLFTTYCFNDPNCLGYIKIGPRGFGKSSKEVAICLEEMTKTPHRRQAAIQSKTKDDAKDKIFAEKMVPVYLELPEFYKPEADHGTKPEGKLSFFRQAVRGRKSKNIKQDDDLELKNIIYPVAAKETTLDGGTFAIIMQDEIGKTLKEEANVHKRWEINRFCVYRDNKKRGMLLGTTTVEEMKQGGEQCFKIWKESDSRIKSGNGMTISGAYRFFTSKLEVSCFDEYGYPDIKLATERDDAERALRKDDLNSLASYIRKNPRNPDEAFMDDADGCEFNSFLLAKVLQELELKDPTTVFDLEWTNGRDTDVKFEYNPRGKFTASWLPANKSETNLVEAGPSYTKQDGTVVRTWKPKNDLRFRIGCDPVQHGVETVDKRVSDSATYVFRMFDHSVDNDVNKVYKESDFDDPNDYRIGRLKWKTYVPIVEYIYRNDDPDDFFEDMIKLCRFFGCQILIENNKNNIINKFFDRGYKEFIMYRPKDTWTADGSSQSTPGIPGVGPVQQQYIGEIKTYIMQHAHRIPFKRLVKDLIKFRKKNITMHDPTVAFGVTLLALKGVAKVPKIPVDLGSLIRTYNNKGMQSTINKN
jgi:hypothetical protein